MIAAAIAIAVEAPMRHHSASPNPYESATQRPDCIR